MTESRARLTNGLSIRRSKKTNLMNEKHIKAYISWFDSVAGAYTRMHFLRAHIDTL